MSDLIDRQAAIKAGKFQNNNLQETPDVRDCYVRLSDLKKAIERNPYNPEEGTIEGYMRYLKYNSMPTIEAQPKWIPVKTRPMDEEERSYWSDIYGYDIGKEDAVTFDCPMPDDGQEVWICFRNGNVEVDTCGIDEGTYLEGNGDWLDVVAWMPYEKPEPYVMGGDNEAD